MEAIVGSGKYTYKVHEDWARVPEGVEMKPAAVAEETRTVVEPPIQRRIGGPKVRESKTSASRPTGYFCCRSRW